MQKQPFYSILEEVVESPWELPGRMDEEREAPVPQKPGLVKRVGPRPAPGRGGPRGAKWTWTKKEHFLPALR